MIAGKRGRGQLLLIALVFLGPLAVAAWLYVAAEGLQPRGRTNHGALLQPFVNLRAQLRADSPLHPHDRNTWVLLYANPGACETDCRGSLHAMRQARLMLGREMERVERVFLHGASPPDTLFLADEHPGLITIEDGSLARLLDNKRPADSETGGYFLIDPHGNLVMYFRPDLDPADMVDDVKHLLRLSRIG